MAKANYTRVDRAIVEVLAPIMRDALSKKVQPKDIFKKVNNAGNKKRKNMMLKEDQMKQIEEASEIGSYKNLDITLLYTLIRNLCGNGTPTDGWKNPPRVENIALYDDVERIRLFRNNYRGHSTTIEMSDDEFRHVWSQLESICRRRSKSNDYIEKLEHIKIAPIDDSVPCKKAAEKTGIKAWQEKNRKFFKTKASEYIHQKIGNCRFLTIAGARGSGKTFLARNLALHYHTFGWLIVSVRSVKKLIKLVETDSNVKQFYIFDDPIGSDDLNILEYNALSQPETIEVMKKCLKSTHIKVVFTCRTHILRERKYTFPINENVDYIDKGNIALNHNEKMGILKQYTEVKFSEDDKKIILNTIIQFPLLCSRIDGTRSRENIVQMFKSPTPLVEEIDKLREDNKKQFCALLILLVHDGELHEIEFLGEEDEEAFQTICSRCCLKKNYSKHKIAEKLNASVGKYVEKEGYTFRFQHDVIMEAVGVIFGQRYPSEMIRYCPMRIIRKKIRFESSPISTQTGVILKREVVDILMTRLLNEIKKGLFIDVVLCPFLREEHFIQIFLKKIKSLSDEEICSLFAKQHTQYTSPSIEIFKRNQSMEARDVEKIMEIIKPYTPVIYEIIANIDKSDFRTFQISIGEIFLKEINDDDFAHLLSLSKQKGEVENEEQFYTKHFMPSCLEVYKKFDCNSVTAYLKLFLDFIKRYSHLREKIPKLREAFQNICADIIDLVSNISVSKEEASKAIDKIYSFDVNVLDFYRITSPFIPYERHHRSRSASLGEAESQMQQLRIDLAMFAPKNTALFYFAAFDHCEIFSQVFEKIVKKGKSLENLGLFSATCICGSLSNARMVLNNLGFVHEEWVFQNICVSPLHIASAFLHTKLIAAILSFKPYQSYINKEDSMKRLPLHYALSSLAGTVTPNIETMGKETVQILLGQKIDLNKMDAFGMTTIHYACMVCSEKILNMFLSRKDVDLNVRDNQKRSPLIVAVEHNNIQAVKILLSEPQVNVDLCNRYECSPLHIASAHGYHKIIVHLLRKRAKVNLKDLKGHTPLHFASDSGHQEVVESLLEYGADIDIKDNNGDTPIFHSVYQGHSSIAQVLLKKGANCSQRNSAGESLLHVSSRTGNKLIVEMLVKKMQILDITREQDNYTSLMLAAANGKTDVMRFLIERAANINFSSPEGMTPLLMAIQNKQTLAVDLLLSKNAYIDEKEESMLKPFIFCATEGNVEILETLLDNGASINVRDADGRTALWYASRFGRVEIVHTLVGKNANANLCDENSYSPIFIASTHGHETVCRVLRDVCDSEHFQLEKFKSLLAAAYFGHLNVVHVFFEKGTDARYISSISMAALSGNTRILEFLIEKYKDSDFLDQEMRKALLLAIRNGKLDCVQFLFERGVRAYVITEYFKQRSKMYEGSKMKGFSIDQETQKYTALHVAAKYNQPQITHYILKNGVDVNISTQNGESPLYIAAEMGSKEVIKVLLKHSANVNDANNQGITPLMVASKKGFVHIVSMLVQKNANINDISIDGKSALWYAVKHGQADIVSLLLRSTRDIKISENDIANLFRISLLDCNVKIANFLFCFTRKQLPNLSVQFQYQFEKVKPFLFRLQKMITKRQAIQRHLRLGWLVRGKFKYLLWTWYVHANWIKTTIFKKQTREIEIIVCKSDCSLDFYRKINFPSKSYQMHSGKIQIFKQQRRGISSRKIQQLFRMQRRYFAMKISLYKLFNQQTEKILPSTEVVKASMKGDVGRINALIQSNTNLNICSCNRGSPINFACEYGYCDIVRILLKNKPNIILCPEQHISPLIIATMNGNYEMTCCILSLLENLSMKEKTSYINKRTLKGRTALWYAAGHGYSDIATELIKHRASVNLSDNTGISPMYIASRNGHFDVLNCLVQSGASDFSESLIVASAVGHYSIVSFFINLTEVDITGKNSKGFTALMAASQNGHATIVELLLQKIILVKFKSAEKNRQIYLGEKNNSFEEAEEHVSSLKNASNSFLQLITDMKNSLWLAVYEGRLEVVRFFLDMDVELSNSRFHAIPLLNISVARGFEDIARLLIQNGALVNESDKYNFTPLIIASALGNNVLVKECLRLCDKVKEHDSDQAFSLIVATEQGFVDVVETLVSNGAAADIHTKNNGTTTLMYATRNHHYTMAEYLINKNANIDEKQNDGKTAVWIASSVNSLRILELLLSRNADVNLPDNEKNSPLHVAIANNNFKAMQLLLRFGADTSVCNVYGKTPYQMAFPRKRLTRFLSYHNCKQLYQREDLDRKTPSQQKRKSLENNTNTVNTVNTVNIDKQRRYFANNSIISNYGLRPVPMKRDGNCFFNALLEQMDSATNSVDNIRDVTCNHLAENYKHYSKFLTCQQHEELAEVYSAQLTKLRESSIWNERLADCMPLAAANVFQRPIRIFPAFDGDIKIIVPDLSRVTGSFFNLRHDPTPGSEHYDALIHI